MALASPGPWLFPRLSPCHQYYQLCPYRPQAHDPQRPLHPLGSASVALPIPSLLRPSQGSEPVASLEPPRSFPRSDAISTPQYPQAANAARWVWRQSHVQAHEPLQEPRHPPSTSRAVSIGSITKWSKNATTTTTGSSSSVTPARISRTLRLMAASFVSRFQPATIFTHPCASQTSEFSALPLALTSSPALPRPSGRYLGPEQAK